MKKLIAIFGTATNSTPQFRLFTVEDLKEWATKTAENNEIEIDFNESDDNFEDVKVSIDETFGDYGVDIYISFMDGLDEESKNILKNNL